MPLTHKPFGITSFGAPVFGNGMFGPNSKVFFVDDLNGNDGRPGESPDTAVKTLSRGESLLRANRHDTLVMIGLSPASILTETLTWDKDFTHLVGVANPLLESQRARIETTAITTPMLNVTAKGCSFRNIKLFHAVANAAALVCCQVTGGRNYFENIHFAGIGNATQDAAAAASLLLNGAEENLFRNCTIGLDTAGRGTALNWELAFDGLATRNRFEDCKFTSLTETATHVFVKEIDTSGTDRVTIYKNCEFINFSSNDGFDMTQAFDLTAGGPTRHHLLINPVALNVLNWETSASGLLHIIGQSSMGATTGLAVDVTP